MRDLTNKETIDAFMRILARGVRQDVRVYFTGGVSAVLMGWRDSTVDVDLRLEPELDEVLRSIPRIKEELMVNIELASPPDFIPHVPGWETRSKFIDRVGQVSYYHFDFYSQALSKIERGHMQDTSDVRQMLDTDLVERDRLVELFGEIEPFLYKYPAIDPASFSLAVQQVVSGPDS